MLARLREIFKQILLVGPWLLILLVVSLALVTPATLQNLLNNIAQASFISRIVIVTVVYGALGLFLYRRYPQYFARLMPKRDGKESSPVQKDETSTPSVFDRVSSAIDRKPKTEKVSPPQPVSSSNVLSTSSDVVAKAPVPSEPDMSEDEFYSFLESVSEDKQEGSG
ncbi:MAG: hypothetical protein RLP44_07170 [Aggregatilineales bacterium]